MNTHYTPENADKIDAMVFTLEADENNTSDYPIWLNILDNENDLFDTIVITIDKYGTVSRSKWDMGVDKYFKAGSMNYIIVQAKDDFDWTNAYRLRFGSGYTQHYYPDCTYYFDDLGYTEDTTALMMELLNVPEYHFYPMETTGNPKLTVETESSWAKFEWSEVPTANRYVLNLYTKSSVGYTIFTSVQTSDISRTVNTLSTLTKYTAQVLVIDEEGNIIESSDTVEFTTTDRNSPEYLKGPLTATKGYYPNAVWLYDSNIEVYWNHIEGVTYYIVVLFEKIDGKYVYADHLAADSECFVEFTGLDNKEYYAQVILYDVSDMPVLAFELMQPTFVDVVKEQPSDSEETPSESDDSGKTEQSTDSEDDGKNESGISEDESLESFDDNEDTSSEDDLAQFEENDSDEDDETNTQRKKKKYKKIIKYQQSYDYIVWVIIGVAGGIVVIAAIVAIILIKKRKK